MAESALLLVVYLRVRRSTKPHESTRSQLSEIFADLVIDDTITSCIVFEKRSIKKGTRSCAGGKAVRVRM